MKVLRHPVVLLTVIFAVLAVVAFVFIVRVTIRDSTELFTQPANIEYTQWELPAGAKMRLGKGQINDIKFSPDGKRFAVATTIGVWVYDAKNGTEISLFQGDRQDIKGIAFSSDGSSLTGASSSGTISRWNVDNGELQDIIPRDNRVLMYSAVFSEDATRLACVTIHKSTDEVQVWNLNNPIPPTIKDIYVSNTEGVAPTIALSQDNRFLATAKEEKEDICPIHVWNADTGERLLTLDNNEHTSINALVFSPDNKTLASCDYRTIRLWDLDTSTLLRTFKTEFGLRTLAFSPDGKLLASGDDATVSLWNTTSKQQGLKARFTQYITAFKLKGHKEDISSLAFSPDGKMLLSGSDDGTIRAWDTTTGQQKYICPGHAGKVSDIAALESGNTLISIHSWEDQLIKWDINTGHPLSSASFNGKSLETISPKASVVAVDDYAWSFIVDRKLKLLDVSKNRLQANLKGHGYPSEYWSLLLAFSSDEKSVAVTSSKHQIGVIYMWDTANPQKSFFSKIFNPKTIPPKFTLQGQPLEVDSLAFSPNGKILASSGDGGKINLWNVETGKLLFTLTVNRRSIDNLVFSPDGKLVASVDYAIIYLWDLETQKMLRKINTGKSVNALLFSPDSRILVGGGNGSIKLLHVDSGHILSTHIGHTSWLLKDINKLIFLDEGKTLVSACEDGTILLWDWEKIARIDN